MFVEPRISQNHSPAQAQKRNKNYEKAALRLRWCFPVFEGASGHVFGRFSEGFGMDSPCFSERFRGTFFTEKLAVERLTPIRSKAFRD